MARDFLSRARAALPPDVLAPDGPRVLVALSGGADSSALIHALHALMSRQVVAGHVNHGLRGAESDRDGRFARELCAGLGVPVLVRAVDVRGRAERAGESIELAARELRYAALSGMAREVGAQYIATAHTASDNAETLLLNLMRGAGPRGLAGIPPERGMGGVTVIRPLLWASRADVLAYCEQNGIKYVDDSSNATDDYARNRVRHNVAPRILELCPDFERMCARTGALLRADDDLLMTLAREALAALRAPVTGSDIVGVDAARLAARPEALRGRIVRLYAECIGCAPLEQAHVSAVLELARRGVTGSEAALPGGFTAGVYYGVLVIYKRPPSMDFCAELRLGRTVIEAAGIAVTLEKVKEIRKIHNLFNTAAFSCGIINSIVRMRARRPGDAYSPAGRAGRKTARRLLMDAKVPAFLRPRHFVLENGDGRVLWLRGFTPDESVSPIDGGAGVLLTIEQAGGDIWTGT